METREHEFPWMVLIQNGCNWESEGKDSICGGSLISPTLVLSAAHCIDCDLNGRNDISYAILGVHEWSGEFLEKTPDHTHYVIPIIDKLTSKTLKENDMAIYVLEKPAKLSRKVCPILLPSRDEFVSQKEAIVAGWGINKTAGVRSLVLRKCDTKVPSITTDLFDNSMTQCHIYQEDQITRCYVIFIPKKVSCGSCKGDSGILILITKILLARNIPKVGH